ncbi:hypothetical protein ACGFNP_53995 [Nonomuraea sp. NPDC049269]|uniref:hypothetical protein n=1 Tax=Nonomuraea sp. NPDC049269 TaxID=3364349 RepID=UPI0037203C47
MHSDTSPAPTRHPTGAFFSRAATRGLRQNGGSPRCSPPSGAQNAVAATHGTRHATRTAAGRSGVIRTSWTPSASSVTVQASSAAAVAVSSVPPATMRTSRVSAGARSCGCQIPVAVVISAPGG